MADVAAHLCTEFSSQDFFSLAPPWTQLGMKQVEPSNRFPLKQLLPQSPHIHGIAAILHTSECQHVHGDFENKSMCIKLL